MGMYIYTAGFHVIVMLLLGGFMYKVAEFEDLLPWPWVLLSVAASGAVFFWLDWGVLWAVVSQILPLGVMTGVNYLRQR